MDIPCPFCREPWDMDCIHEEIGERKWPSETSYEKKYVPAVVRYAIPEANASLYFGMSLEITFPFNIVIGIPLYFTMLGSFWS